MQAGRFNGWMMSHPEGITLRPWEPAPESGALVACVILKLADLPTLIARSNSWVRAVDRVVVVLGAWSRTESARELKAAEKELRRAFENCDVIMPPEGGWANQVAKRTAYFRACQPGEVAMVVDADEEILETAPAIKAAAARAFDVGWITISAPRRYARPYAQPRLFRIPESGLEYRHRHYWVYATDGRLVAKHSYGGAGWMHQRLPLTFQNHGGERTPAHAKQWEQENEHIDSPLDHSRFKLEPLRIAQVMHYDAGLVAYRLHTAINSTTRERSLMISSQAPEDNPLRGPWQYDLRDRGLAKHILKGADVLHVHVAYDALEAAGGANAGQPVIIHHHGSVYRNDPALCDRQDVRAALRLASTWDLMNRDKTGTLRWLPNPMPVALYARMAHAARLQRPFDATVRIVTSPSKPKIKGTAVLMQAVERLKAKGLKLELDIITETSHASALWRKASADICFDSFWLGIQCSGLEAAAMGMPVIAGDSDVAFAYQREFGAVPYTFADEASLEAILERLVVDHEYRWREAARVHQYVVQYHDEAAVALRYLELLREALRNTSVMATVLAEKVAEERKARAKLLRQEPVHEAPSAGYRLHGGPR